MTDLYKELGKRVRTLRRAAGFTQFDLAELAEINPDFISKIERAQSGVSLHTLEKIATALNVPLRKLIEAPPSGSAKAATSAEAEVQWILLYVRRKSIRELKIIRRILEQVELLSKTDSH